MTSHLAFRQYVGKYTDLSRLNGSTGWKKVPCPFPGHKHGDRDPALSINLAKQAFKCHVCGAKGGGLKKFRQLIAKHGIQPLAARRNGHKGPGGGGALSTQNLPKPLKPGLKLSKLADAKKLPRKFLRSVGVKSAPYYNRHGAIIHRVAIVYRDTEGNEAAIRYRAALEGSERFTWRKGDHLGLYGLDRAAEIKATGQVHIVEGESDSWTAWYNGLPALGLPGKEAWPKCWSRTPLEIRDLLAQTRVFLWQEPDALKLPQIVGDDLPHLRVIIPPEGIKDLSDLYLRDGGKTAAAVEILTRKALPLDQWRRRTETAEDKARRHANAAQAKVFAEYAKPVLDLHDPLVQVLKEFRRQRYGGDRRIVLFAYLAATSRLLKLERGAMPSHMLLISVPGAGKNFVVNNVAWLMPENAWYQIDAGSPRAWIFDDEPIRHRVIVFEEADSLPSNEKEDNPAASALRTLLQKGEMKYSQTVKDETGGGHRTKHYYRPGPAVLITTSTRRFPPQMDSRVFTLDVRDDQKQIQAALKAQADTELYGRPEPDPALVAFQSYLQAKAPWSVVVPYVHALRILISRTVGLSSRMNRYFSRILALIKSVAILRHRHRRKDGRGRLKATINDYKIVYGLLDGLDEGTATGAAQAIREVVEAVAKVRQSPRIGVNLTKVAEHMKLSLPTVSGRVKRAVEEGWLINEGHGQSYSLKLGNTLPTRTGLPTPEEVGRMFKALRQKKQGYSTPLPPSTKRPRTPRRSA